MTPRTNLDRYYLAIEMLPEAFTEAQFKNLMRLALLYRENDKDVSFRWKGKIVTLSKEMLQDPKATKLAIEMLWRKG